MKSKEFVEEYLRMLNLILKDPFRFDDVFNNREFVIDISGDEKTFVFFYKQDKLEYIIIRKIFDCSCDEEKKYDMFKYELILNGLLGIETETPFIFRTIGGLIKNGLTQKMK